MGDVRNLLAGRIMSAIMFFFLFFFFCFFLPETSLTPAIFVSNIRNGHLANRLPKRLVMDLTQSIFCLVAVLHV